MHNSLNIGKVLHHYLSVESTNDKAKDMLSKTKPSSGSVIIADFQTKGRGQRLNTWESESGKNILASIIFLHTLNADESFYLNKLVCIAIVETLSLIIPNETIEIKWPNDILVNKKKIAGILIENTIYNNQIQQSIIGIGLNINQESFQNLNACSLTQFTHSTHDLYYLLELLFNFHENWLQNLLYKRYNLIDSVYNKLLFGLNKEIIYQIDNINYTGSIQAVNKDGSILVKNLETLITKQHYFKQIKFIY